jgi:hypothetical protein
MIRTPTDIAGGLGCSRRSSGHGRPKDDTLYGIRMILRCGAEKLNERQRARLERAIATDERHDEVYVAWQNVAS